MKNSAFAQANHREQYLITVEGQDRMAVRKYWKLFRDFGKVEREVRRICFYADVGLYLKVMAYAEQVCK